MRYSQILGYTFVKLQLKKFRGLMSNIEETIEKELQNAREVCSTEGANSGDCAAAWDAVEELQAEASHQRQNQPAKTDFQKYCDDNPDAVECRMYED